MDSSDISAVRDKIADAIRNNDPATVMRIVTEQIESTSGAQKAFWLRYRAMAKRDYGQAWNQASVESDLAEANLADPSDVTSAVKDILSLASSEQRMSHLTKISPALRPAIRRHLFGDWRYWAQIGYLHGLRRRFPQSYRAYTRALRLFRGISPEELKNNHGWAIVAYCWHARAAVRVGRVAEATEDAARAAEFDGGKERRHLNPIYLAIAQAEVAFAEGRPRAAIEHLQVGRNRVAAVQLRIDPMAQIACDLIAARIARAEGNLTGFQHFCDRALAAAIENKLPLTEAEVRAVMGGALW